MKADLSSIVEPLLKKTFEVCPNLTNEDVCIVVNPKLFGQGGYKLFGVDVIADPAIEFDKIMVMQKKDYVWRYE